jgi:(5-formylfuran-3-yl)methyl phosphate synthase
VACTIEDPFYGTVSMNSLRPTTRFLASVRTIGEARMCVIAGADLIDCKEPNKGALGALPLDVVRAIRAEVPADRLVSATVGDLIPDPATVVPAVAAMAETGVDYVKIGFFPGGDARATIQALARGDYNTAQLVGLLLADRDPDFSLIEDMGHAGFAGVMIDTASKSAGALPEVLSRATLTSFIETAHGAGLFAGLAGSLRLNHIVALLALKPDLLGFRGALCRAGDRCGVLDPNALQEIREAIPSALSAPGLKQKVLS